jgi:hypothetical protein
MITHPRRGHFLLANWFRDSDTTRMGRIITQHNIPLAEEKVLITARHMQRKNFILVPNLEYATIMHVVIQNIGMKYIICTPNNQFSYWIGEKTRIFETKNIKIRCN